MEKDNKQYCWHSSVVDYEVGVALVLRPSADDEDMLEIAAVPLSELMEQTLELIGTNVNGNPYGKFSFNMHLCYCQRRSFLNKLLLKSSLTFLKSLIFPCVWV